MMWVDGSLYEGEWSNGTQHGYGIMVLPSGDKKEGFFENGVFKREGSKDEI
jgi:hypothetical protein